MSNVDVVKNKILNIIKYLKILKRYQKFSKKEIKENIDTCGMVERYLYLLCQAAIELAEAFISYKKYRQPTTMRESFDILFEEKIISRILCEKLRNLVGFRNILAHEYANINYDIVFDVLHNQIEDTKSLADKIKKHI